ncbi:MAG: hypothetical protein ACYC0V_21450 [Armatimonadota bacterium]
MGFTIVAGMGAADSILRYIRLRANTQNLTAAFDVLASVACSRCEPSPYYGASAAGNRSNDLIASICLRVDD